MYRILIAPMAQRLLRTLPDPIVSRVGHLIAKTADEAGAGSGKKAAASGKKAAAARARVARLEVEGLALTYAIDPDEHTLTVRRISPA